MVTGVFNFDGSAQSFFFNLGVLVEIANAAVVLVLALEQLGRVTGSPSDNRIL
jgi:hypothetical protein